MSQINLRTFSTKQLPQPLFNDQPQVMTFTIQFVSFAISGSTWCSSSLSSHVLACGSARDVTSSTLGCCFSSSGNCILIIAIHWLERVHLRYLFLCQRAHTREVATRYSHVETLGKTSTTRSNMMTYILEEKPFYVVNIPHFSSDPRD